MSEVVIIVEGHAGRLRLNGPAALHALTTDMCAVMLDALAAWRADPAVAIVLIDHAEGRGFCAGGDIRMLSTSGTGDGAEPRDFFRTEYRLNHALFTFAKPIAAFMDVVTMGGVGIALPCRWRVATENTRFAMPETAIGLFPDVGGGWYLSRLSGRMGQYLALTGARLNWADCLALGLATHYITSVKLPETKQWLVERPAAEIDNILTGMSDVPDDGTIMGHRDVIDRLFASDDLEAILAALKADGSGFAHETPATINTRSPQAIKVSLKLLLDGATMPTFEDEMGREYAVATRIVQRPDFAEGVRAVIVDKDNAPRWDPPEPAGVSDHMIDRIFAPLPDAEAWTPA